MFTGLVKLSSRSFFQKLDSTIIHRIFGTNSNFHVKWRTTGKAYFLFYKSFLLVLIKFSHWQGDWVLGYHSMGFRHFRYIS